jgi:hypothetical protein
MDSLDEWNWEVNEDTWTYIWGTGIFTSKQAYEQIIGHNQAPALFQWFLEVVLPRDAQHLPLVITQ